MKGGSVAVILIMFIAVVASWGYTSSHESSQTSQRIDLNEQIQYYEQLRIYKKLIPLYEELISLDEDNINAYVKLADVYYSSNQYSNYEKVCETIISKFPNDITGYYKLALYYQQDNDHDQVIEVYKSLPFELQDNEDIVAVYRDSEYEYTYLGSSYNEIGQYNGKFAMVKQQEQYGYVGEGGSTDIEPIFDLARPFIEDQAAVYHNNEWYMIDEDGDRLSATKETVEDLYSISEGYAVAKIGGEYGFVDELFNKIQFGYDGASSFYNGVAAVKKGSHWAIVDKSFNNITEYMYDDILVDEFNICSRKGIIFAKKDGDYHMLSLDGSLISENTYSDVKVIGSDALIAAKQDNLWGFIDITGKTIIDFKYEDANSFNVGLAPVEINDKWGYININEELVIPNEFDGASPLSKLGIAHVKIGETYRLFQLIQYQ